LLTRLVQCSRGKSRRLRIRSIWGMIRAGALRVASHVSLARLALPGAAHQNRRPVGGRGLRPGRQSVGSQPRRTERRCGASTAPASTAPAWIPTPR
jgi:hypothetical protein